MKTRPLFMNRLRHLTSGSETRTNETAEGQFVQQMNNISLKESEAQGKLVAFGNDCRIKTSKWKNLVVVKIWPGFKVEAQDEVIGQFEQRYKITSDSKNFPKEQAGLYPAPGSEEGGWEINIVKSLPGLDSDAPLIGLVQNHNHLLIRLHS